MKGDSNSLSVGILWEYWTETKLEEYGDEMRMQYNGFLEGYSAEKAKTIKEDTINDLLNDIQSKIILPKYENLKEEVLHYEHITYKQYRQDILPKAEQYVHTNIAKSWASEDCIAFFIYATDPIEINHLITLILYCDYTDLCTDFRKSFRKTHQFELLAHIKRRNQKYYHFSRILRETMRRFGQTYSTSANVLLGVLRGPFYTGMSVVLNVPQFNICLHSPTSTSVHLEVAIKFADVEGMILEFDNSKGPGTGITGMDCSWISRYKEEDERYVVFGIA